MKVYRCWQTLRPNFAPDVPRFPHPHDDNFPFTPEHLFTGKREILIDVLIKLRRAFTFNRGTSLPALLKVKKPGCNSTCDIMRFQLFN